MKTDREQIQLIHQDCDAQIEALKKAQVTESNMAILRHITPGTADYVALPDGVKLEIRCIPIKGSTSSVRPYGDFTAYISTSGRKYHCKRGCSGAITPIHILSRSDKLTPCANCVEENRDTSLPEWYCRITGRSANAQQQEPAPIAQTQHTSTSAMLSASQYSDTKDPQE